MMIYFRLGEFFALKFVYLKDYGVVWSVDWYLRPERFTNFHSKSPESFRDWFRVFFAIQNNGSTEVHLFRNQIAEIFTASAHINFLQVSAKPFDCAALSDCRSFMALFRFETEFVTVRGRRSVSTGYFPGRNVDWSK